MKRWTAGVGLALATWVAAGSAQAGDGRVPEATLRALGLGSMTIVSDTDGLQVRARGLEVSLTILRPVFVHVQVERQTTVVRSVKEQITFSFGEREFTLTTVRPVLERRTFEQTTTAVKLVPVTITIPRGGAGGPGTP